MSPNPQTQESRSWASGWWVLIADDDQDFAELLRELLEEEGYRVALARNGQEALDLMGARGLPAVLLLDMRMPVINGYEVLEQMQCHGLSGRTCVIAMTAFVTSVDRERFLDAGACAVLSKPVSLDEILRQIRRLAAPGSAEQT